MPACLEVIQTGSGVTIQDRGRYAFRRFGVTPSGPMDWAAFLTVQRVLGNPDNAAAIEISAGGLELACVEAPVDVAFGGGGFNWTRDGKALSAAMRLRLRPGERLAVKPGSWGAWAYLGVAGGFDRPIEMGSRATHLRSGIGGGMLKSGDRLGVLPGEGFASGRDARIAASWLKRDESPIRILLGPQDDYFDAEALDQLVSGPFTLTASLDRMAYRFTGPKIAHAKGFNIVSDGIALGAIQIGGDGQPLVLMADHQPTGGYPKIAYVIKADIGRLAQLRPGDLCHFVRCDMSAARAALFALEDNIAAAACVEQVIAADISSKHLRSVNLIDGVVISPLHMSRR